MLIRRIWKRSFGSSSANQFEEMMQTVEKFCVENIAPRAAEMDKTNEFPRELWPKMGSMGLHGVTVPTEYGGLGLSYQHHVRMMESISRHSASLGLSYGAHSNLCINQIARHASPEQKRKYLPRLVSGDWLGALAMSESGSGSDVVSMRLRAERTSDGYVLNGHKMWITNGPDADVFFVYAKTDANKISAFLIEKDTKGFTRAQKLDKLGMRGSGTCELVFEDCHILKSALVGQEGRGVYILMTGLDYERVVLAGGPLGIMQACLDVAIPYVQQRHQFGQPIANFQLVQAAIADIYTQLTASRALVYECARKLDDDPVSDKRSSAAAILFSAEAATQCALKTVQLLGGNGYINEYPAGRLLRDAKLYEIGAGTSEIRRLLIGKDLLFPKK